MGKYVHVCPYCNVAKGFKGGGGKKNLVCLNCGHEVTREEWKNSPIIPKPGYVDYFRENPERWREIVRG